MEDRAFRRVVMGLQYDGSPWHGWQTQTSGLTVQDRLERALERFACVPLQTYCAGRTDAGVHALEQVVHFDTEVARAAQSWVRGVNAFLPQSIAVRWAAEVPAVSPDGFHARFSARSRTYVYALYNHRVRAPVLVGRTGWSFLTLQLEAMQQAAATLIGTHDFSAFRSVDCQAKTPVKTLQRIDIARRGDLLLLTFQADAFLHHMVRNIVGSLIHVGAGKQRVEWIADLLASRDRSRAAPTFMPDGLYLAKIDYDAQWQLPQEVSGTMPWPA